MFSAPRLISAALSIAGLILSGLPLQIVMLQLRKLTRNSICKMSLSFFHKKGQGSFEFIMILAILAVVATGTMGVVQSKVSSVIKDRQDILLESTGNIVSGEILLAEEANGDYYRKFMLPYSLEGKNYTIGIPGPADIVLRDGDSAAVIFLNLNVTGSLQKGENVIRKVGDKIFLNS